MFDGLEAKMESEQFKEGLLERAANVLADDYVEDFKKAYPNLEALRESVELINSGEGVYIPPMPDEITMGPSTVGYLSRCDRCTYLHCRCNVRRPSGGFPGMFGTIDRAQSGHFKGKPLDSIHPGLGAGDIIDTQRWLRAFVEADDVQYQLRGPCDLIAIKHDGFHLIGDFKTADPAKHPPEDYAFQLNAYCMGSTQSGDKADTWAVLYYQPDSYSPLDTQEIRHGLFGSVSVDIRQHEPDSIVEKLKEISAVIKRDEVPDPSPDCNFCRYNLAVSDYVTHY